jgi:uncharacterized protein (DUF2267 family)
LEKGDVMKYDEFIGQVQHRARLSSRGEAVQATRATLEVLRQRLAGGEPKDLASQLPPEIGRYLRGAEAAEGFDLEEFFKRVSEKESAELPEAIHHARAVISVLKEAVTPGEMEDIRAQLPDGFGPLFESGSEGALSGGH